MTDDAKVAAKLSVEALEASTPAPTNVHAGLDEAAKVLGGRRHWNDVASVILVSSAGRPPARRGGRAAAADGATVRESEREREGMKTMRWVDISGPIGHRIADKVQIPDRAHFAVRASLHGGLLALQKPIATCSAVQWPIGGPLMNVESVA